MSSDKQEATSTSEHHPVAVSPPHTQKRTSLSVEVLTAIPLPIDRLREQFQWFERFKNEILTKDDWANIKNKRFRKKSAWRKIGFAFNVSDELVSYRRVPTEGRDKDGNFYYEVITRAFHPATGRTSTGVAIASRNEKKTWSHEEHDIFALAATRSKNRAISDLVGGGEVSAEEMMADAESGSATSIGSDDEDVAPEQSVTQENLSEPVVSQAPPEYPLLYNKRNVGNVRIDRERSEAVFIPDKPIPEDCGPVKGFMQPRILEPLTTKHNLQYRLDVRDGMVQSVTITPLPEPKQLEELMTGISWTFAKGSEPNTS
jgi:hypothetical protein